MNKKSTFLAAGLLLAAMGTQAQYQPVALTGFNADIIANGVGPATGSVTPGTNADNGSFALVSKDFRAVATNNVPTYGLPVTGNFTSAATTGVSYQLADYSSNNALRLTTAAPSGTLSFVTPLPTTDLYILAYSGNGPANTNYTITFSDATTQTGTLSINDWYSTGTYAIQGIGRVSVSGDNGLEGTSTNPRLFEFKVPMVGANIGKQISSVTFTKTSVGTTLAGIMGMSVFFDVNIYAPVTISNGFNADVIANGVGAPSTTTTSDVDGATPPYVFISADYKYNSTCAAPSRSLPTTGAITSGITTGLNFQLRNYDSTNDLRLALTSSGTLTFATPTTANTVYLLSVGGGGAARINATVTFSDNTTQVFNNVDIGDWYGGTANIATQGIGRVSRTVTACAGTETSTTSPKLFQIPLVITSANTSKLITSVTVTRVNGVTGFAGLANIMAVSVAKPNPSLPVSLKAFSGVRNGEGNLLQWTTATEQNNAGFDIERSADGFNFSKISYVASKATNGNSSTEITYSLTDKFNIKAAAYYRLKQVDKDGKATYSQVVFIKAINGNPLTISAVYPNPVKGSLQVQLTASKAENLNFIVVDATGKVVLQKAMQVAEGANLLNMNVEQLHAGNYFIKAVAVNGETNLAKFVKY